MYESLVLNTSLTRWAIRSKLTSDPVCNILNLEKSVQPSIESLDTSRLTCTMPVAAQTRQADTAQRNIPILRTSVPLSPTAPFSQKPAHPKSPFHQATVSRMVSRRARGKRTDATNGFVGAHQEWRVHWRAAARLVMAAAGVVEVKAALKNRSDTSSQVHHRKKILVAEIH